MNWKLIILHICCFTLFNAFSQDYISGEITQNTSWRGDIYINGDVTVPRNVTLVITEGTQVHFLAKTDVLNAGKDRERSEFIVQGVLIAKNTDPQKPITFTSQSEKPQMNDWYGIIFKNFYEKSILQNCIVEFGYRGVSCVGSSPLVNECEIRFNHNSGISCEVRSNPEITGTLLYGNGFAGIHCELASTPKVCESTITQNNYGVIIFSKSEPDLGRYPIVNEYSKGENRIHNNFEFDIYNHSVNQIYAQNNFWNTSNLQEIRLALYDKQDNPAYGEIIFQPIFFQRRPYVQPPGAIALLNQPPVTQTTGDVSVQSSTTVLKKNMQFDSTKLAVTISPESTTPESSEETEVSPVQKDSAPEKMLSYTEKRLAEPQIIQSESNEAILEVFLDSGKREYISREQPEYPKMYRNAGKEGDVIIEVIVDKQGKISEHRVLKSDGDLFTEASVKALLKFRYKPGTKNGQPVKYKVVELFRFKLSGS
jgi:TonB family protein